MKCVGYSKRTSFIKEYSVDSLKEQNDRIRKYAKKHGFKIERFYEDKSNDPESDIGFQEMRKDGINLMFDVVILDSIYRCGKNVSYAKELLLKTFYPAGINFIILDDNINSFETSGDELEKYFISIRQRSNIILGNTKKNEMLIKEKKISNLRISYGYKLNEDETEIIIDEYAAGIIRRIFKMIYDGYSINEVCRVLNDEGVEPPSLYLYNTYHLQTKGKTHEWNKSVCQNLRRRERFLGEDVDLGYMVIHYPAIINQETFNMVKEMIKGTTRAYKGKKEFNAFNHKIFYCNTENNLTYDRTKGEDSYRYFYYLSKKNKVITYDAVEAAVKECLADEKVHCEKLAEKISKGSNQDLINDLKVEFKVKAEKLFEESFAAVEGLVPYFKKYENNEISGEEYRKKHDSMIDDLRVSNDDFDTLIQEFESKKREISQENMWIVRFMKYDENSDLTKSVVNNLVDKIIVNEDRTVDVYLNDTESKVFPEEWRNTGGKKAQESR